MILSSARKERILVDNKLNKLFDKCYILENKIQHLKEENSNADTFEMEQELNNLQEEKRLLRIKYDSLENEVIKENEELCKKYPFLKVSDDEHCYTWLDYMPGGWILAFGDQLCEDIKQCIDKVDWETYCEDDPEWNHYYKVVQVKEKFGGLRWYVNSLPEEIFEEHNKIIDKYERLSERTCCVCGKPATKLSGGWILPYCDDCAEEGIEYIELKKEN